MSLNNNKTISHNSNNFLLVKLHYCQFKCLTGLRSLRYAYSTLYAQSVLSRDAMRAGLTGTFFEFKVSVSV